VGAVPGQLHLIGDLLEAGLGPVTELGDQSLDRLGHGAPLRTGGRDDHLDAGGGHLRGERAAVEPLVQKQRNDQGGFAANQVGADLPLIDRCGHDRPGPHDPAAQAGAGPGRRGISRAPTLIASSTKQ
jgi:hypothetical protein